MYYVKGMTITETKNKDLGESRIVWKEINVQTRKMESDKLYWDPYTI